MAVERTLRPVEPAGYPRLRPLAEGAPLALAAAATLEGTCPGAAWADDPARPTAAVVDTPEGHYVIGDPAAPGFGPALVELIRATLGPGGRGEHWWWYYLRCPTPAWAEALRPLLPAERTVEKAREFYVCRRVAVDWRERIPDGYTLHRVDEPFLARQDIAEVAQFAEHGRDNFVSVDQFLARGFAFCLVHDGRIAAHCSADNASGRRCEVGVHTAPGYRRRGLATVVVAAAVGWALSNGFAEVGWHCLGHNLASAATARRVGFVKAADYTAFKVCTGAVDAGLQRGNLGLMAGDYAAAAGCYEQALNAFQRDGPASSHLLAQPDALSRYLLLAAAARLMAGGPVKAGDTAAGGELLARAVEAAGLRQGGF